MIVMDVTLENRELMVTIREEVRVSFDIVHKIEQDSVNATTIIENVLRDMFSTWVAEGYEYTTNLYELLLGEGR